MNSNVHEILRKTKPDFTHYKNGSIIKLHNRRIMFSVVPEDDKLHKCSLTPGKIFKVQIHRYINYQSHEDLKTFKNNHCCFLIPMSAKSRHGVLVTVLHLSEESFCALIAGGEVFISK
jgi:hypothetical protein